MLRLAVIELGAGGALPSLFSTTLSEPPALVVVTDYPDEIIIGNLRRNMERNKGHVTPGCKVYVQGYEWGKEASDLLQLLPDPMTKFDIVILSDLLHFHDSHAALVESVSMLLSKDPDSRAGKYTGDNVCSQFVDMARGNGLVIEEERDESDWQGSLNVSGLDVHGLTLRKRNCRFWMGQWKA
ncbi:hypothetical protein APHAL10511_006735 [Amanita phalloides]|nr:hypothetical protein APHAL10511_006735 [Amanita phalloides]